MRSFSYSAFVDIFRRAGTLDGVQYSGLKTLHYIPPDALALPKM